MELRETHALPIIGTMALDYSFSMVTLGKGKPNQTSKTMLPNFQSLWFLLTTTLAVFCLLLVIRSGITTLDQDQIIETERKRVKDLIKEEIAIISSYPHDVQEPLPLSHKQFYQIQALLNLELKIAKSNRSIQ